MKKFKVEKEKKKRSFRVPRAKKGVNRTGAKKEVVDGIAFRSKLEVYFYLRCKENGIDVDYEPVTVETLSPFIFEGKKVRNISYTIDFIGDDFQVEIKGFRSNESFPVRFKLYKKALIDSNYQVVNTKTEHVIDLSNRKVFILKNQGEINEWIKNYKNDRSTTKR